MKKIIDIMLTTCSMLFAGTSGYSQNKITCEAGSSYHPIYIPYSPSTHVAGKTTSALILPIIDADFDAGANDAIYYACQIWSQIISSPVGITIHFKNSTTLAGSGSLAATSVAPVENFGASDTRYVPNFVYPWPLANKLHGSLVPCTDPYDMEIEIAYTVPPSGKTWNTALYGGASSTEYDLVSVVVHEIAHGLGFETSASVPAGTGTSYVYYGEPSDPFYYDGNVVVDGSEMLFYSNGTAILTDACTSGYARWRASSSSAAWDAHLYCPSVFRNGSSLSHLDDSYYMDGELMQHARNTGEVIHNPSSIDMGVLNDIGWECSGTVGIEDRVTIIDASTTGAPNQILSVGSTFNHYMLFHDELPYGDYCDMFSAHWELTAVAEGIGLVTIQTRDGNYFWNETLTTLPSGYNWHRDINGRIQGYITATVNDNHGYVHTDKIDIGINFPPGPTQISLTDKSMPGNCDNVKISFCAPGADHYIIHRKHSFFGFYTLGWSSETLLPGINSVDYTGLDQTEYDKFYVEAVNSDGTSSSPEIERIACSSFASTLAVVPNAFNENVTLTATDGFNIGSVTITSITDPLNTFTQAFIAPFSSSVNLSTINLPIGTYVITATNENGYVASALGIKQ